MQPPPPIQANRSYTRPIQPPTDFDPTQQQRRPSHASTTTRTQDGTADWDPRLSMRRSSSSRSQGGATTSSNEKPEDWAADEESSKHSTSPVVRMKVRLMSFTK